MKAVFAALGLLALAVPPVQAADMDHSHMKHEAAKPAAAAAMTEGVVKKLDKAAAKVTLTHGPIDNLAMPGMTMAFAVKNPAQLDALKVGDKVRFRAEQQNGAITVVAIEPAK